MSKKTKSNTGWRESNITIFILLILIDIIILSTKNYQDLNWRLQWILARAGMFSIGYGIAYFLFLRKFINKKTLMKEDYKLGDRFIIINMGMSILSFVFILNLSMSDYLSAAGIVFVAISIISFIMKSMVPSSRPRT